MEHGNVHKTRSTAEKHLLDVRVRMLSIRSLKICNTAPCIRVFGNRSYKYTHTLKLCEAPLTVKTQ